MMTRAEEIIEEAEEFAAKYEDRQSHLIGWLKGAIKTLCIEQDGILAQIITICDDDDLYEIERLDHIRYLITSDRLEERCAKNNSINPAA